SESLRPGAGNWPDILDETRHALDALPQDADGMTRYFLGAHSPYSCTPELMREVKLAAEGLDLPFDIHLAECEAEVDTIRERHGTTPLRLASELGLLDHRTI